MKREAVIVSAVRTPVGKYRGGFSTLKHEQLAAIAMKEAVARAKVDPEKIDEVYFGNLTGLQYNNMARYAALEAGIPVSVPATTMDKQCGTSVTAVAIAAMLIESGNMDCALAGGVNMDTRRVWMFEKPDQPFAMAHPKPLYPATSPEAFNEPSMLVTAENLAVKYGLTREECDRFAYESHQKAAKAQAEGYFKENTVPVTAPLGRGKEIVVSQDETVRADTSVEALGALPVVSGVAGGIVTPGNSSPFSDGASAVVVMEKEMAKAIGAPILATFRGYATAGVEPHIMGIGPAPATRKLLAKTGLTLGDIDLIELNEAFAAQSLAVVKELGLDTSKLNVNGGAIALGHPLAATGGMLISKMVSELKRRAARYGLVTFCCGGGQGVAMLLENEG